MKILPHIYLWISKFKLNFGIHPDTESITDSGATLCTQDTNLIGDCFTHVPMFE